MTDSPDSERPQMRRAVLLMTASSFLIPAVGVLTQPILAQALGVEGRGQLAAALAPSYLAVAVATLGLPEALTYYIAKDPTITRRAVVSATLISVLLGVACLGATYIALPLLAFGDSTLEKLTLLAMAITAPTMIVNALRGAAMGQQRWGTVASERLLNTMCRVVALLILWPLGLLDVLTALLVTAAAPLLSGVVYWRVAFGRHVTPEGTPTSRAIARQITSYGTRIWFGAVASMLLSRVAQVLMAPLSNVTELGLYSVATTISDLPLVVAVGIQGALFGVSAKVADSQKLTQSARLTLLLAVVGSSVLGCTLPLWLGSLFGEEFRPALVPTLLLLVSAVVCVPGLMAATGVSAWGRPGLRSIGLTVTLLVNVGVFVVTVPTLGALGAGIASLVGNVVLATFMTIVASRLMGVRPSDFLVIRASDLIRAWGEVTRLLTRLRLPGRTASRLQGQRSREE